MMKIVNRAIDILILSSKSFEKLRPFLVPLNFHCVGYINSLQLMFNYKIDSLSTHPCPYCHPCCSLLINAGLVYVDISLVETWFPGDTESYIAYRAISRNTSRKHTTDISLVTFGHLGVLSTYENGSIYGCSLYQLFGERGGFLTFPCSQLCKRLVVY
jgi:hypothetical protein